MPSNREIEAVLCSHNGLVYNLEENFLEGELQIAPNDFYNVKIDLSTYPDAFPTVYETDGRIKKVVDRHIYPSSGACCLTTGAKAEILLKTKVKSLLTFIDEIVVRYFENNSFYEINGYYYTKEYSHGPTGIIESYMDILGTSSVYSIAYMMVERINGKIIGSQELCYCNSKISMAKCSSGVHLKKYSDFQLVSILQLKRDLEYINNELYTKKSRL